MTLLLVITEDTVVDLTPPTAHALYDELGVTQPRDRDLGWPFLILIIGIGAALGRLPLVVRDTDEGPGWSMVLDLERVPDWALPWLAQFVGVRLRPGDPPEVSRARIAAHAQFNRGTPAAMRAAALTATYLDDDETLQPALIGTQHLSIIEHADGDPYLLRAFTLTSETAAPDVVTAALLSQKPAGMKLIHQVVDGTVWAEATSTWDTAPGTWATASDEPI